MLKVGKIYEIISLLLIVISLINRDLVPGGLDYLFFLLLGGVSLKTMIGNKDFKYPKYYIGIFLIFLIFILFNSFISPYSPGFLYIAIATIVTVLPFITFLLSYNIAFDAGEINSYIDKIITLICVIAGLIYVENVIVPPSTRVDSFIASDLFMYGFFASMCSQTVILSLARYHTTKQEKYLCVIAFLFLTVLLMNQLKAILCCSMAIVVYLFFMSQMSKILKIAVLSVGVTAFTIWILVSGSFMIEKALKYTNYIVDEDEGEGIARVVLYVKSSEIARDFFPLGTGQGTLGSIPVNIIYSNVYYDYELSDIWGLTEDNEVNFKMDTHWANALGEMGVLGLVVYIILLIYPMIAVGRLRRRKEEWSTAEKGFSFYIYCGIAILILESFVLALPNRMCFMLLYAGLTSLIVRNMYSSENLLEYEDSADND